MMFKLQHPANLVSRLFMLEYLREIDTKVLYERANKYQKKELFYKFTNDENKEESVDVNWEYCIFEATIPQMEGFMKHFLVEIQEVEDRREAFYKQQLQEKQKYEAAQPTDINVMDLAATEINKNNKSGFQLN
jgi:hypothetical protein